VHLYIQKDKSQVVMKPDKSTGRKKEELAVAHPAERFFNH